MFKIGQKVVFKPQAPLQINKFHKPPSDGEIVEIIGFESNSYCFLLGYELDNQGKSQPINVRHLRKLDHNFAENILKEISESFKTEAIQN